MIKIFDYIAEIAFIVVIALLIVGSIIKELEFIANKFIPLILLPFGICFTCLLIGYSGGGKIYARRFE